MDDGYGLRKELNQGINGEEKIESGEQGLGFLVLLVVLVRPIHCLSAKEV